ncbi:hypothetical protein ABW21_db0207672 [Orbilia brochopaga]|nr:hypothetical protein ABW21_db0207672 [Drechslerella brochopaga]
MIAVTFPNIEEFELDLLRGLVSSPPFSEYQELGNAKKLRKVTVPAPTGLVASVPDEEIRNIIKQWVKSGLRELERVEMVKCGTGFGSKFWLCEILQDEEICILKWGDAQRPLMTEEILEARPWRPYLVTRTKDKDHEEPLEYVDGYTVHPIFDETDHDQTQSEPSHDNEPEWDPHESAIDYYLWDYEYPRYYPGDESESSGAEEQRARGELTWGRETSQKLSRRRRDGDKRKQPRKRAAGTSGKGSRKAGGSSRPNPTHEMLEPPEDLYWDD